jgi:hypothetical protein
LCDAAHPLVDTHLFGLQVVDRALEACGDSHLFAFGDR